MEGAQMKKIILGSFMMLSGMLGAALLLSGTMANNMIIDGHWSFAWNLSAFGLMPALIIFIIVGVVGLILGVWGLFDKKAD